jgi:hypothetical protein
MEKNLNLKQIQEFFSKPLEENTFKVGDKITYLGHPGEITATKEYNGRNFVSVSYDKGKGKTKASDILTTDGTVKAVAEGFKDYLGYSSVEVSRPTQDQVDRFFALTQNETHYLNSKPVAGQEKTFNKMEVEPWDEYDLSNWNSLVRKAKAKGKSLDEAQKKLPKFKNIPSWAKYLAQHSDGEWYFYEETPTMIKFKDGSGGAWKQDGNQTYTGVKTDGKDWDKIPTYYNVKNGKITESVNESPDVNSLKKIHDAVLKFLKTKKGVGEVKESPEFPNRYGDNVSTFSVKYNIEDKYNYDLQEIKIEYSTSRVFIPNKGYFPFKTFNDIKNIINKKSSLKESVNEGKTYKKGDKLKIKLKNGNEFDLTFDSYGRQKGMAFGKFKDGSGEYDTKPFSLDTIKESVNEAEEDPIDIITMDVPLFIRILEYSREDAQEDMDLHDLTEKAIEATKQQGILQMDDYDMLVGSKEPMNKLTVAEKVIAQLKEAKPGLWANINAKQKRGEKPSHGNSDAFKSAKKAGKKINSLKEEEGVPHFTKDGKEWKGKTHKMPDDSLMSGNPHDKNGSGPNGKSEKLFHKEDLNEINEGVDMAELEFTLKRTKKENPGKKIGYAFFKDAPKGYRISINGKYTNESVNEAAKGIVKGDEAIATAYPVVKSFIA